MADSAAPPAPVESQRRSGRPRRSLLSRVPSILFLLALVYVLAVLLEGLLIRLPANTAGTPAPGERLGVIHIHTNASDGSGTVPEVMAAAREDDLSFMAITDHNVSMEPSALAAAAPDFSILSGEELSTNSGHFLTLGIAPGWQRPASGNADTLLTAARSAGGFNVIAHPYHTRIPWTDWKTDDFEGLEIWNGDEVWRRDHWIDLFNAVLLYGVNDKLALVRLARRPAANFAKWDELTAQRPVVGMCGADAHAAVKLGRGRFLRFPGYSTVFLVNREHVLLPAGAGGGDPSRASAAEILDALRHGHAFCALDALYPSGGFISKVSSGAASGGPGDMVILAGSRAGAGTVHVAVPAGSPRPLIKVMRNGLEIAEKEDWTLDTPLPGPGRYRAEVYLRQPGVFGWGKWALWIFSNPTYVNPASDGALVSSAAPAR